jgi:hypothetical protein
METILELLKIDLGITHDKRDKYFTALIEAAEKELNRKGCNIDITAVDDQMLVVDYACWTYRKRQTNESLPNNLQLRIRNRIIRTRSGADAE